MIVSFMLRNTSEVLFNRSPTDGFEVKIENEKCAVGGSCLFYGIALTQNTSRKCTKTRAARVVRLFVRFRSIVSCLCIMSFPPT